jgi:hypothetical protein
MIYWLCAIAFIAGFSDTFSINLMNRFLDNYQKNKDEGSDGGEEQAGKH